MKNRARSLVRIGFLMLFLALLIPGAAQAKKTAKKKTDSYVIKINKLQNTVTVYKKRKAIKAFPCSTGRITPTGTFRIQQRMRAGMCSKDLVMDNIAAVFIRVFCFIRSGITNRIREHCPIAVTIGSERWHRMDAFV